MVKPDGQIVTWFFVEKVWSPWGEHEQLRKNVKSGYLYARKYGCYKKKNALPLCSLFLLTSFVVINIISQKGSTIEKIIQTSIILTYEVVGRLSDIPMKLQNRVRPSAIVLSPILTKMPELG